MAKPAKPSEPIEPALRLAERLHAALKADPDYYAEDLPSVQGGAVAPGALFHVRDSETGDRYRIRVIRY